MSKDEDKAKGRARRHHLHHRILLLRLQEESRRARARRACPFRQDDGRRPFRRYEHQHRSERGANQLSPARFGESKSSRRSGVVCTNPKIGTRNCRGRESDKSGVKWKKVTAVNDELARVREQEMKKVDMINAEADLFKAQQERIEANSRDAVAKGKALCVTPSGVDIVGITEFLALIGASASDLGETTKRLKSTS